MTSFAPKSAPPWLDQRRRDISLSGDDEDTADVIGEVLDDDEERHDTLQSLQDSEEDLGFDADPDDFPTLPREATLLSFMAC